MQILLPTSDTSRLSVDGYGPPLEPPGVVGPVTPRGVAPLGDMGGEPVNIKANSSPSNATCGSLYRLSMYAYILREPASKLSSSSEDCILPFSFG
jgi:hypothetical protein